MANKRNTVLHTDVTNHLQSRVLEHRKRQGGVFTSKYNI
jgi:predicted GIY-YIG superfamily endonuclease